MILTLYHFKSFAKSHNDFLPLNVLRLNLKHYIFLNLKSTNQISASTSRTFNNQSNTFNVIFMILLKI